MAGPVPRKVLQLAAAAMVAAALWAPAAQAAVVGNPGAVTITGVSAGGPGDVGGLSLEGLSAAGSVDPDGNLLFPVAGITIAPWELGPLTSGPVELDSRTIAFEPTHDATGVIDPASGAASLKIRSAVTMTLVGQIEAGSVSIGFVATCDVGDVTEPAELPFSTEQLDPPGPDMPIPYDQATGTAKLVGRPSLPGIGDDDCEFSGSFGAAFLDAFAELFLGMVEDLDDAPLVLAARFDPPPHAPGFPPLDPIAPSPPADPGTAPTIPTVPTVLPDPPSNVFELGRLRASPLNGVTTLVLTLHGPGAVSATATANVGKATAARRIRVARVKRTVQRAGRMTLKLKPSKAAKRILRRKGRLRARVKITYTPTGGAPRSVSRAITLKAKRSR